MVKANLNLNTYGIQNINKRDNMTKYLVIGRDKNNSKYWYYIQRKNKKEVLEDAQMSAFYPSFIFTLPQMKKAEIKSEYKPLGLKGGIGPYGSRIREW